MPAPSHYFERLCGVPVHYDRQPVADYGSLGVPRRFYATPATEAALDALFQEVFALAPPRFGAPVAILSAGAYVDKPGQHGAGKAFDLDGILWQHRRFLTSEQRQDKVLYLGIQACCLRHFGTVLGYNYNVAHQDHLHIDLGRPVAFRESKSVTYFYQEVLNAFFDKNLTIDGEYGSSTNDALRAARTSMGLGSISKVDNYRAFLAGIAAIVKDTLAVQPETALV